MKVFDHCLSAVITLFVVLVVFVVDSTINGEPGYKTPTGLQSQIESIREKMIDSQQLVELDRKYENHLKVLDMRTEHLNSEAFLKSIEEKSDWRAAPEVRRAQLINHKQMLVTQTAALRRAIEKNKELLELTEWAEKRDQKMLDEELKATPAPEQDAVGPPPPATPTVEVPAPVIPPR